MTTRFNFILDPSVELQSRPENRILAETRSFAVVPSLGSLVPGWLLVVPKRPLLNCSQLAEPERKELSRLVDSLLERLKGIHERVFAFEHGSSRVGSASGCGVDQAHLHLVPLPFDLLSAVREETQMRWHPIYKKSVSDCLVRATKNEYIMVHDVGTGAGIIGYPERPTSQWVRRVIASKLGRADDWNYRVNSGQANIAETLALFKSTV